MNDNQYFPTPDDTIAKMIAPLIQTVTVPKWKRNNITDEWQEMNVFPTARKILEPSAGQGHILDYLVDKWAYSKRDAICVEIDGNNRAVLQTKGYRVVGFDFLDYDELYPVDLIVMNPPFADADSHILKAWSILAWGDIIALCNAETIRNPYTRERQVLSELVNRYGSVEYIGQAFIDAEISTDVEVAIVRLRKEKEEGLFDFDVALDKDETIDDGELVNNGELAPVNIVESLVAQYNKARETIVRINELEKVKRFYTRGILPDIKDEENRKALAVQLDELKAEFWNYVFKRTKIGDTATSKFRDDFYHYKEQNKHIAFTYDNVMQILSVFWHGRDDFMRRCIADTFDAATRYHQKNQLHVEGWKHNLSYMVAKKIIMPNVVDRFTGYWKITYTSGDFIRDLDKCCCSLSGKRYEDIVTIEQAFNNHVKHMNAEYSVNYYDEFQSTFFAIRMWKKGTLWLTFRDLALWAKFNQVAADGKNWIGGGY